VNLTHPFAYETFPRIRLIVHSTETGLTADIDALIDTGAEYSILDLNVAQDLELNLDGAQSIEMTPVGGHTFEAKVSPVRLSLLQVPELRIETLVLFANDVATTPGNLIGLDVLQYFDLAILHSQRRGLIGVSFQ
jgi:predicted aspartyl protease